MVNKKLFIILLGLCCVLFAALVFNNNDEHGFDTGNSDELFLPELKNQLTEIKRIEIDSTAESVVLEIHNNNWAVASKQNYPADIISIRQFIYGIAELKILEVKTHDESLLSKIGLAQDSDDAVRIRIVDGSGNSISDILFGLSQAGLSGQGQDWFVRQFDDSQSWLVNGQFLLKSSAYQWLSKTILSLDTNDVREIVLNANQDDSLVIIKSEDAQPFELQGKKDSEEIETYKLDDIVETASSIQLDDVRLKQADQSAGDEASIKLRTKNGLIVFITVIDAEKGWISLLAQSEMDDQIVTEQSTRLNKQWSDWEFKIPVYKLESLLQNKQDLISKNQSS